jgi:hypothetical protein
MLIMAMVAILKYSIINAQLHIPKTFIWSFITIRPKCFFLGSKYILKLDVNLLKCNLGFDEWHDTCLKFLFLNYKTGTPVSSTNKTDRHNITEILVNVKHHKSIPPYNILLYYTLRFYFREASMQSDQIWFYNN